jgi:hypothetical protein
LEETSKIIRKIGFMLKLEMIRDLIIIKIKISTTDTKNLNRRKENKLNKQVILKNIMKRKKDKKNTQKEEILTLRDLKSQNMINQENKEKNKNNSNILKLSNQQITYQEDSIQELSQLNKQLKFKNQKLLFNNRKLQKQLNLRLLNKLQRNRKRSNLNQKMMVGSLLRREDDLYE